MSNHSEKVRETNLSTASQLVKTPFFKAEGSDGFFAGATQQSGIIQRKPTEPPMIEDLNRAAFNRLMSKWSDTDKILEAKARALAKSYLASNPIFTTNPSKPSMLSASTSLHTPQPGSNPHSITTFQTQASSEDRIVNALKSKMELHKTGKGNDFKDWTFTWKNEDRMREKTRDEKALDIAEWGLKEAVGKVGEIAVKQESKLAKAAVEVTLELIDGEMFAAALFATGAGEVIAAGMLLIGIFDLLIELGEPQKKELSPYEQQNGDIVDAVRNFLLQKQRTASKKNFIQAPVITSDHHPYRSK